MISSATIAFSSDYTPYGDTYALVGVEALMYTGKLLDPTTGLYYEGARYYDQKTGRFITEDSVAGSTSDPQSLNRYMYARDNPMKIVDMNGHEWWNPVADISSAVSTVVGAATDVANAASNAWNSLPPQDQAVITTAAIDVGAIAGSIVQPELAPTLIGAAISATAYTVTAGSKANAAAVVGAAVAGGVSVGVAAPLSGVLAGTFGAFAPAIAGAASSLAGNVAAIGTTARVGGRPTINPEQFMLDAAIGAAAPGVSSKITDKVTGALDISPVGRPATHLTTLVSGFFNPSENPRAAYQVYSGLVATVVGTAGGVFLRTYGFR